MAQQDLSQPLASLVPQRLSGTRSLLPLGTDGPPWGPPGAHSGSTHLRHLDRGGSAHLGPPEGSLHPRARAGPREELMEEGPAGGAGSGARPEGSFPGPLPCWGRRWGLHPLP